MSYVDGNALAGVLADVFGVEMTAAIALCRHCQRIFELAVAHVFITAMGSVMRCAHCQSTLAVIVNKPHETLFSPTGLSFVAAPRS